MFRFALIPALVMSVSTLATPPAAAEEVRALQQILSERDCNPGPVDGAWGRRTAAALERHNLYTGLDVARPIEVEDIAAMEAIAFSCADIRPINAYVPVDVMAELDALPADERRQVCRASPAARSIVNTTLPLDRLVGLNSKMSNRGSVAGFAELESMASAVSQLATEALVHNDPTTKRQLLEALSRWATLDAYGNTRNCGPGAGCPPDWQRADGTDLSPPKDHSTVVDNIAQMAHPYYAVLADFEPDALQEHHRVVQDWLATLGPRSFNRSGNTIYFGLAMGHQWTHGLMERLAGNDSAANERLRRLVERFPEVVGSDGAFKDRTTRGDRAIWYHHTALAELILSKEMARANGIEITPDLEARTHAAVGLFLDALEDPSSILPWASISHNNGSDGRNQDFLRGNFETTDWGSSWAYIYIHRHPDHPQSARLRALLNEVSPLHPSDRVVGVNLGCLYRVLDPGFRKQEIEGISAFEASIETSEVAYEGIFVRMAGNGSDWEDYKINIDRARFGETEKRFMAFGVLVDYASSARSTDQVRLMRLYIDVTNLQPNHTNPPDFEACGEVAYNSEWRNIRLHYGDHQPLNRCILKQLRSDDLTLWYSVFRSIRSVLDNEDAVGTEALDRLRAAFETVSLQR